MNKRLSLLEIQKKLVARILDHRTDMNQGKLDNLPQCHNFAFSLMKDFVFKKRKRNLRSILPATFREFSESLATLFESFAEEQPQITTDAYQNACSFIGFLEEQDKKYNSIPPLMLDLTRLEIAIARLDNLNSLEVLSQPQRQKSSSNSNISLCWGIDFVHCQFNVLPLLKSSLTPDLQTPNEIFVVVARCDLNVAPRVFQVPELIFRWLEDFVSEDGSIVNLDKEKRIIDQLLDRGILTCP